MSNANRPPSLYLELSEKEIEILELAQLSQAKLAALHYLLLLNEHSDIALDEVQQQIAQVLNLPIQPSSSDTSISSLPPYHELSVLISIFAHLIDDEFDQLHLLKENSLASKLNYVKAIVSWTQKNFSPKRYGSVGLSGTAKKELITANIKIIQSLITHSTNSDNRTQVYQQILNFILHQQQNGNLQEAFHFALSLTQMLIGGFTSNAISIALDENTNPLISHQFKGLMPSFGDTSHEFATRFQAIVSMAYLQVINLQVKLYPLHLKHSRLENLLEPLLVDHPQDPVSVITKAEKLIALASSVRTLLTTISGIKHSPLDLSFNFVLDIILGLLVYNANFDEELAGGQHRWGYYATLAEIFETNKLAISLLRDYLSYVNAEQSTDEYHPELLKDNLTMAFFSIEFFSRGAHILTSLIDEAHSTSQNTGKYFLKTIFLVESLGGLDPSVYGEPVEELLTKTMELINGVLNSKTSDRLEYHTNRLSLLEAYANQLDTNKVFAAILSYVKHHVGTHDFFLMAYRLTSRDEIKNNTSIASFFNGIRWLIEFQRLRIQIGNSEFSTFSVQDIQQTARARLKLANMLILKLAQHE